LYERGDGLFGLPLVFTVSVCTAQKGTLPDSSLWTIEKFIEEYKKNSLLADEGRDYLIKWLKAGIFNEFVDTENGICRFENPEFISILEWFSTIEEKDIDEFAMQFGKDVPMIYETTVYRLSDYIKALIQWDGNIDSGYMLGYPSSSGGTAKVDCGTYYMVNSSGNTAGAAVFLKHMMSSDYLCGEYTGRSELVSVKSVMKERMDLYGDMWMYFSGSRFNHISESTIRNNAPGNAIEIQATQEIKFLFYDLLDNAFPETVIPSELEKIFDEELSYYFSGKSVNNTVKVLQIRTSLWLAEHIES
jgi:hypothetical protein